LILALCVQKNAKWICMCKNNRIINECLSQQLREAPITEVNVKTSSTGADL